MAYYEGTEGHVNVEMGFGEQITNRTLLLGDCLEVMKGIPDNSVDAIITDPPYEIGYDVWDSALDWGALIREFDRVTTENANIVIFQGWSRVCGTIQSIGGIWELKNWIIYDRIKGRGAKTNLVSTREDILWYTKSSSYTYNKIPSTIKKKTKGLGQKNGNEYRALSNVWSDISPIVPWSKERVAHPTQKPTSLMERCVKVWSNEGHMVLDPFMGSGTTAVACKNLNRSFIGIELDRDYFKIAQDRINGRKE